MTPYYDDGQIQIYHGDCRDILPTLAAGSADLVLTDPPYAEETHQGARTYPKKQSNAPFPPGPAPILLDFDAFTHEQMRACFNEIGRIAAAWVVSFMDWHHIYRMEQEPPAGLRFVRFGVWVKPNGAPQFTGDRPATGWEGIAIMHRDSGRMQWHGGGRHAVWTYNKAHQDSYPGTHRTVKPLPLVCELVRLFSNPGDLVVDPFGGSGTTAEACKRLGRRCIIIEKEEQYCHDATRRLSQEVFAFEEVAS